MSKVMMMEVLVVMKGDEYEEDNHDKDSDGKDPQDETD